MFGCSKTIVILIFATWIAPWPTYGLPHEFQINPIATCGVIEDRSKVEKTCIFPFSFRNITYTNCTTVTDPDNKAWSQFQQLTFCLQLFTIVRPFYNYYTFWDKWSSFLIQSPINKVVKKNWNQVFDKSRPEWSSLWIWRVLGVLSGRVHTGVKDNNDSHNHVNYYYDDYNCHDNTSTNHNYSRCHWSYKHRKFQDSSEWNSWR